jgi:hypothetical protein
MHICGAGTRPSRLWGGKRGKIKVKQSKAKNEEAKKWYDSEDVRVREFFFSIITNAASPPKITPTQSGSTSRTSKPTIAPATTTTTTTAAAAAAQLSSLQEEDDAFSSSTKMFLNTEGSAAVSRHKCARPTGMALTACICV